MTDVEHVSTIKAAPQYKWKEAPSSSASSVPIPEGGSGLESQQSRIDKVLSGVLDSERNVKEERDPNTKTFAHLELLESDVVLHKKGTVGGELGITTRAVWLEWETHKHLWLPPMKSGDQPEFLVGSMYQKKQGKGTGWKQRDFRADMVPGVLSYTSKETYATVMLWIVTGCIIQRISGKFEGRVGCIRVLWPSGYDIIISTIDEEPSCSRWYDYLCSMLNPQAEYLRRRQALSHSLASVLHRSSIRSQKSKEQTPYGAASHTRHLAKLSLQVQSSFSDSFATKQDAAMFRSLYDLRTREQQDHSSEWVSWATMGRPNLNYLSSSLPEVHYATCPATTEISAAWEQLVAQFPDRHFEEVRRFLVNANFSVPQAAEALRKHIEWRSAALPIRPRTIAPELNKGNCFVRGFDHHGCPLIYYFVEKQRGEIAETSRLEDQVKACLYRLEQAIARLPVRDGKVSVLLCFPRAVAETYVRNTALAIALARVVASNYPERLHALLVYPRSSAGLLDLAKEGLSSLPSDITQRIIPVPDEASLRLYVPASCLPVQFAGEDQYTFASDVAENRGSPVLMPPLWLGLSEDWAESAVTVKDYYPPPSQGTDQKDVHDGYEAPEPEPVFLCQYCKLRRAGDIGNTETPGVSVEPEASQCALCRYANRSDDYYGGWKPVDMSKYPEPSAESFAKLARELGAGEGKGAKHRGTAL